MALDFETANRHRASACSIGAAKVRNGQIIDTFSSLIKPPAGLDEFFWKNIEIHGIHSCDVESSPDFLKVWKDFEVFAEDLPLVAHGASFDMSVVNKALPIFGASPTKRTYACSLELSRKHLSLVTYSLPFVIDALELGDFEHHNSLSDAMACAQATVEFANQIGVDSLAELVAQSGLEIGEIGPDGLASSRMRRGAAADLTNGKREAIRSSIDLSEVDQGNTFFGKKVVFTGKLHSMERAEAQLEIMKLGGDAPSSVARDVNFLVIGELDLRTLRPGATMSAKFEKAMALRNRGATIEVLDEESFLRMLDEAKGL